MPAKSPAETRFWPKVTLPSTPDGCLEWTGARTWNGYGTFSANGHRTLAHRFAYEWLVGPIPTGLDIDHLCRNRGCVNPNHLEPVTRQENILRGEAAERLRAKYAARTHCRNGHPYNAANLYLYKNGYRYCRACRAANHAKYRRTS